MPRGRGPIGVARCRGRWASGSGRHPPHRRRRVARELLQQRLSAPQGQPEAHPEPQAGHRAVHSRSVLLQGWRGGLGGSAPGSAAGLYLHQGRHAAAGNDRWPAGSQGRPQAPEDRSLRCRHGLVLPVLAPRFGVGRVEVPAPPWPRRRHASAQGRRLGAHSNGPGARRLDGLLALRSHPEPPGSVLRGVRVAVGAAADEERDCCCQAPIEPMRSRVLRESDPTGAARSQQRPMACPERQR